MAEFKVIMPKLGESIQEGTITKWFVKEGDMVKEDDLLFEVATDKVDSEIPSPVEGRVTRILFPENTLLPVGEVIAYILEGEDEAEGNAGDALKLPVDEAVTEAVPAETVKEPGSPGNVRGLSNRFYSPLVKKIAEEEKVTFTELESIEGTGAGGRVQKKDILAYISERTISPAKAQADSPGFGVTTYRSPGSGVSAGFRSGHFIFAEDRKARISGFHRG